jgi:hypothetical protein
MNKQEKAVWDKLKKEDCFPFIEAYYNTIGRTNPPDYKEYSLQELKKCMVLFNIHLQREQVLEKIKNDKE